LIARESALYKFELYFRNILTRLRHTAAMSKRSLKFHIRANDYFGTLATVLDLVSQDLRKKGFRLNADTLSRQRDRLMYLQQGYRIEKIRPQSQHHVLPG